MLKIAILGNMNNNGFALLRYFIDLGQDAKLFLYDNDGIGELSHFAIENDTWEINKWSKRISRIDISDNSLSALPGIYGRLVIFLYNTFFRKSKYKIKFMSEKKLLDIFDDFELIIASGIAPAVFERINRKLGIYYHYSDHIEYVGSSWFTKIIDESSLGKRLLYKYARNKQILGISNAIKIYSAVESSVKFLSSLNGSVSIKLIPMLYVESSPEIKHIELTNLNKISCLKKQGKFIIFSHARIRWKRSQNYNEFEWNKESKGTDILIKGFSNFTKIYPDAILVLVAYGPDVELSKQLVESLNISHNVVWFQTTNRKEILEILKIVNVACGEFTRVHNMIWGGTAIEAMSVGTPLLQTINFSTEDFMKLYGFNLPYIFDIKNIDDITRSLNYIYENEEDCRLHSLQNINWFNNYLGTGLAKDWLGFH